MITDFILYAVYGAVYLLLAPFRALPDVSISSAISEAVTTAGTYLANVNQVFPVTTLVTIILILLTVEVGVFLYKTIMWLIKKIPGIN